jgi:DNA-binding NarL/FixJ family response regulator
MNAKQERQAPIRVMITGANELLCEGTAFAFDQLEEFEVSVVCDKPAETCRLILEARPDVLVVNYHTHKEEMLDLTIQVTRACDQKVLGLGIDLADTSAAAITADTGGFVVFLETSAQLVPIIREISRGELVAATAADYQELLKSHCALKRQAGTFSPEDLFIIDLARLVVADSDQEGPLSSDPADAQELCEGIDKPACGVKKKAPN